MTQPCFGEHYIPLQHLGITLVLPWYYLGITLVLPWYYLGITLVLPWYGLVVRLNHEMPGLLAAASCAQISHGRHLCCDLPASCVWLEGVTCVAQSWLVTCLLPWKCQVQSQGQICRLCGGVSPGPHSGRSSGCSGVLTNTESVRFFLALAKQKQSWGSSAVTTSFAPAKSLCAALSCAAGIWGGTNHGAKDGGHT